ncbi:aldo/keto reductase [Brucella ceti]|uniref:aldo/keto reductase n=1 Tax=Brucella ceti TaxID=120577 RepID=UPI00352EDF4E
MHPQFQQDELRLFHGKHDIATEAWSPLGQGKLLEDPTLKSIAEKHAKSVAQIILRWHIETGNIVIPKSITPARIKENFDTDITRRFSQVPAFSSACGVGPP